MITIEPVIALALCLVAAVATVGIGAFLLRGASHEVLELAAQLPTRLVTENSSQSREANRRNALDEMTKLLLIRTAPGGLLVICGIGLLVWAFWKFLGGIV